MMPVRWHFFRTRAPVRFGRVPRELHCDSWPSKVALRLSEYSIRSPQSSRTIPDGCFLLDSFKPEPVESHRQTTKAIGRRRLPAHSWKSRARGGRLRVWPDPRLSLPSARIPHGSATMDWFYCAEICLPASMKSCL